MPRHKDPGAGSLGGSRALILIIVAACLAFGPVCANRAYFWDDYCHFANPAIQQLSLASLAEIWSRPFFFMYIPVTYTAWSMVIALKGLAGWTDALPFHILNLAVHIANICLVFLIARRIVKDETAALLGALLFGLHPLQVESVAWISELRGLLAGFFSFLALHVHLGRPEDGRASAGGRRRLAAWLLLLLLAILAKPSAASLPLAMLLADLLTGERPLVSAIKGTLPGFLLSAAALLMASDLQSTRSELIASMHPGERLLVAMHALGFYITKLVRPLPLSVDYGLSPETVLDDRLLPLFVCLPVLLAVLLAARSRRQHLLSGLIFVSGLLPVLGLVQFFFQFISTVTDRYAYMAMLGPALSAGLVLKSLRPRPARPVAVSVLVLLALVSFHRSDQWRSESGLFTATLEANPRSWISLYNLTQNYIAAPELRLKLLRETLRLKPEYTAALGTLAELLRERNGLPAGERTALAPSSPDEVAEAAGRRDAGMAALRNGERKQAYLDLVAAMALNPADPATPAALGAAMNELRLFRFSVPVLKLATQLNQDDAGALDDLAFAYRCLGQQGDAERTLEALVPETTGAGGIVAAERKALRDGRGPLPIRLSPGSQEPPAPAPRMSPKE